MSTYKNDLTHGVKNAGTRFDETVVLWFVPSVKMNACRNEEDETCRLHPSLELKGPSKNHYLATKLHAFNFPTEEFYMWTLFGDTSETSTACMYLILPFGLIFLKNSSTDTPPPPSPLTSTNAHTPHAHTLMHTQHAHTLMHTQAHTLTHTQHAHMHATIMEVMTWLHS